MGQKVHPYGIRLGFVKKWKARWYSKRDFRHLLYEDLMIRKKAKELLKNSAVDNIDIERSAGKVRMIIYTARPGIVIGRKGQEIDRLKTELQKITDKSIYIDIKEIKNPLVHAQLVAENVAQQIERRVAYRRAMKKTISASMGRGADGIKIQCSGRLGGAEIARCESYKEGKIPLNTFRANIDYGFIEAHTTYGVIGVKVWLYLENADLQKPVETTDKKPQTEKKSKPRAKQTEENKGEVDDAINAIES